MTRRTSGGKAKNGMTWGHARRHDATTVGNVVPHERRAKSSSAVPAASALGAA
jgi:hypothetical protein